MKGELHKGWQGIEDLENYLDSHPETWFWTKKYERYPGHAKHTEGHQFGKFVKLRANSNHDLVLSDVCVINLDKIPDFNIGTFKTSQSYEPSYSMEVYGDYANVKGELMKYFSKVMGNEIR